MEKSNKVALVSGIIIVGFIVAVVFHGFLGMYLNLDYPYNTFLFNPKLRFNDLFDITSHLKGFAPYTPPSYWQQYFPLSYLILTPFAYMKDRLIPYSIFSAIFLIPFIATNVKMFKVADKSKLWNVFNIFVLTFLSYPFLVLLDRGNFDMIIFLFFAAFVFAFKSKKYQLAAVLLGIINAMKPFSVIFLAMFIFEKKYREFFLSVATSFLLVFGVFLIFKGNVFEQIAVMLKSIVWFKQAFILYPLGGMSNSSSLFMALKLLFCANSHILSPTQLSKIYGYFSFIMTLFTFVFSWREKVFWKRISLITLYMIVAPSVVFDYKLIFLFVPLYLFVNSKEKSKFDLAYAILFGLLLIPKRFVLFGVWKVAVLSVILNPLIILLFIGLIVLEQFIGANDKSLAK